MSKITKYLISICFVISFFKPDLVVSQEIIVKITNPSSIVGSYDAQIATFGPTRCDLSLIHI